MSALICRIAHEILNVNPPDSSIASDSVESIKGVLNDDPKVKRWDETKLLVSTTG